MSQAALFQANPDADTSADDPDCWCTGPDVMERVHRFWPDGIALDPCSNRWAIANGWVRARTAWRKEDDALKKGRSWASTTLWYQPPYSRDGAPLTKRLTDEFSAGVIDEALALMKLDTSTEWWEQLRAYGSSLVLFPNRLAHYEGDTRRTGSDFCSAMWLLTRGDPKQRRRDLEQAFDGFGWVYG